MQILRGFSSEQMAKCLTLIQALLNQSDELVTRVNHLVKEVSAVVVAVVGQCCCCGCVGPSRLLEPTRVVCQARYLS